MPSPRIGAAALCLGALLPLTDAGLLLGWRWGGVLAVPLLAVYFALCWRRILFTAKVLLVICVGLGAAVLLRPHGWSTLLLGLERMAFLPAFVAALGLLRAAADASPTVARAGRMLVHQPPGRRYAALTAGGHIFGILLNIGGLALLLDMTKRANTLEAGYGDPHVVAIRERRMTLAVMRGFAAIALWSPLGLALNLLLTSMPDVSWFEVAPYGLLAAVGFMTLGLVFDRMENAPPTRPRQADPAGRDGAALATLVGHIVALSGLAMLAELVTNISFQAILINLVPLYAAVWLLTVGRAAGAPPLAFAWEVLRDKGIARWPTYANEIAIFATSGLMGVVLADLAPREALQAAISAANLPGGIFAALLALTVFVIGLLGVNPMVSASILAATLSTITVPGLSHPNIILALAGGWTCIIGVGPLMSSLVMAASVIGRRAAEVGLRWNGRFTLAAISLWIIALMMIRI